MWLWDWTICVVSAAVVAKRKGIGFDQDPMAIFVSETSAEYYDKGAFQTNWNQLKNKFKTFESKHLIYATTCTGGTLTDVTKVNGCKKKARITNFRFVKTNTLSHIVYTCSCQTGYILKKVDANDKDNYLNFKLPADAKWYPTKKFPQTEILGFASAQINLSSNRNV